MPDKKASKPAPKSAKRQAPRTPQRRAARRGLSVIALLALGVGLAVILAGGGFAFAASQEQHDAFCASCHTQPESTYYQRSTAGQPVDLASFHTVKGTACINCHSAPGVSGRMAAELLGARNALHWYTGSAVQPAPLTQAIADGNCLKCHQEATLSRRQNNHFHYFLARWQSVDPNAAHCVTCHGGHTTDGTVDTGFQNVSTTQNTCQNCHNALGEGD